MSDNQKRKFKIRNDDNLQWFIEWDLKLTPKQRKAYRKVIKAYIEYLSAMLDDNATQSRRRQRTANFKGRTVKRVREAVRAFQGHCRRKNCLRR